ncbi:MAG: D-Ala-D-Ala carboxypeptidase family metallohydrolase [Cyanobacteria bacterium P01_D01_bin.56]
MNTATTEPDWIVAERRTYIKPGEKQSSAYNPNELILVEPGAKFFVSRFDEAPGNHWRIEIDEPEYRDLGQRSIYDGDSPAASHWLTSWANDTTEAEVIAAPNVVSTEDKDKPVGDGLTPGMSFSTRITPNFTYGEFALYQEQRRFHYKYQCETAYVLATFLEDVRAEFDSSVRLTSGHRPFVVNQAVGGARNSEHLYSAPLIGAVDIAVAGVSTFQVDKYCLDRWGASVGYDASGFTHVGLRGRKNRRIIWAY